MVMLTSASGGRARSWFMRLRVRRSVSVLRWCQPGPRSANLSSGLASRCQTMTRMERATAHLALLPSRRLDRRGGRGAPGGAAERFAEEGVGAGGAVGGLGAVAAQVGVALSFLRLAAPRPGLAGD